MEEGNVLLCDFEYNYKKFLREIILLKRKVYLLY